MLSLSKSLKYSVLRNCLVYIFFVVYRRGDINFAIPNDGKCHARREKRMKH